MNQLIVEVRALTPDLLPDFLKFFDGTAFSDNPKWSSCYCQCFYEDHRVVKWSERTAPENRARACDRINGELMQGYLAYVDGSPVGWCNAAPRTLLHALDDEPIPDAEQVGEIIVSWLSQASVAAASHGNCSKPLATVCDCKVFALLKVIQEPSPVRLRQTTLDH